MLEFIIFALHLIGVASRHGRVLLFLVFSYSAILRNNNKASPRSSTNIIIVMLLSLAADLTQGLGLWGVSWWGLGSALGFCCLLGELATVVHVVVCG